MAHYVQIPKDLNDIKQKFMFGLTKRQVVSFGIGGALGIPIFFLTRGLLGTSGAIFAMGAVAAPALICGLYKKNGIFFEQVIRNMFCYFKRSRKRIYRTVNLYKCIERQIEYDKLKRLLKRIERE
ncbi:MAG: PrgI family protein [Ruminococcus sp.]|nr:PrgI family protein [Ruminococcus sp.]